MTKLTTTTPDFSMSPLPWVGVKAFTNRADGSSLSLVLLRDLVRWLMRSKSLSFMNAALELHKELKGRLGVRLYVTVDSGAARLVGAADTFDLSPVKRRILSRGIDSGTSAAPAPASLPNGVTPGMLAALHYVGKVWGDGRNPESILDDDKNPASRLAMPCEVAAAMWGGVATIVAVESLPLANTEPLSWAALVSYRKNNAGHAWTQAMRAILVEEERKRKAAGYTAIRKSMASELGSMTSSGLGDHIRKADTGTKSGRGRKVA